MDKLTDLFVKFFLSNTIQLISSINSSITELNGAISKQGCTDGFNLTCTVR